MQLFQSNYPRARALNITDKSLSFVDLTNLNIIVPRLKEVRVNIIFYSDFLMYYKYKDSQLLFIYYVNILTNQGDQINLRGQQI